MKSPGTPFDISYYPKKINPTDNNLSYSKSKLHSFMGNMRKRMGIHVPNEVSAVVTRRVDSGSKFSNYAVGYNGNEAFGGSLTRPTTLATDFWALSTAEAAQLKSSVRAFGMYGWWLRSAPMSSRHGLGSQSVQRRLVPPPRPQVQPEQFDNEANKFLGDAFKGAKMFDSDSGEPKKLPPFSLGQGDAQNAVGAPVAYVDEGGRLQTDFTGLLSTRRAARPAAYLKMENIQKAPIRTYKNGQDIGQRSVFSDYYGKNANGVIQRTTDFILGSCTKSPTRNIGGYIWDIIGYNDGVNRVGVSGSTPGTETLILSNESRGRFPFSESLDVPTDETVLGDFAFRDNEYVSSLLRNAMSSAYEQVKDVLSDEGTVIRGWTPYRSGIMDSSDAEDNPGAEGKGDHFWALSVSQAEKMSNQTRVFGSPWWLRSSVNSNNVHVVEASGGFGERSISDLAAIRPAFYFQPKAPPSVSPSTTTTSHDFSWMVPLDDADYWASINE
jgi:hypothetical protein